LDQTSGQRRRSILCATPPTSAAQSWINPRTSVMKYGHAGCIAHREFARADHASAFLLRQSGQETESTQYSERRSISSSSTTPFFGTLSFRNFSLRKIGIVGHHPSWSSMPLQSACDAAADLTTEVHPTMPRVCPGASVPIKALRFTFALVAAAREIGFEGSVSTTRLASNSQRVFFGPVVGQLPARLI